MCPLRVILIFLSAALAAFFVLRNLKAPPPEENYQEIEEKEQIPIRKKVGSAICTAFWACVDMASGRYLWRNLVANSGKKC